MNISQHINRLIRVQKSNDLPTAANRPSIGVARGIAPYAAPPEVSEGVVLRKEVITVFSRIIITDAGAFERPPAWPTSGAYPGSSFELDTSSQYYEQRRVHLVVYEWDASIQEDRFLIDIAEPFSGFWQGVTNLSAGFAPALYIMSAPDLNDAAQTRLASLQAAI